MTRIEYNAKAWEARIAAIHAPGTYDVILHPVTLREETASHLFWYAFAACLVFFLVVL